jgi:PleD family two-component response regulator
LLSDSDSNDPKQPPISVTVSVGMTALLPDDTMESLVKRTDVALRDAQSSGRNQVKIID